MSCPDFIDMTLHKLVLTLCFPLAACAVKPDATSETQVASASATPAAVDAQDTSIVRADKARIKGSESAKVWLVTSSDFQCPYCRQFHHETWGSIEKDYVATGKIRVAFLNHPMPFHQFAIPAAEAAMCAGKQDKFYPMHDGLFATQERWVKSGNPQPIFDSLATSLGLRMEDWRSCVSTRATRAMVEADFERSKRGGVKGTPSFFIGDQLAIVGVAPYADFRKALDAAIAQANRRP